MTRAPPPEPVALWRRLAAEFLGSGFVAAIVIGSGIAAQQLSPGSTGPVSRLTPAQASDILFPHHASQAGAAQAHATPGGATAAAGPLPGHDPSH